MTTMTRFEILGLDTFAARDYYKEKVDDYLHNYLSVLTTADTLPY